MSGRGLSFSGGTLDKLESIPGFRTDLTISEFKRQLREVGLVVAGQTDELAPADGKLYALRDVTATVPSLPLIASSIMSKKIAAGADAIVLDVKVGHGAFMETEAQALQLAQLMVEIGRRLGRAMTAVLGDMSQPLGLAVGNALEVIEAVATLRGAGPTDFSQHCIEIAAEMILIAGMADGPEAARQQAAGSLTSGAAWSKFRQFVRAQGGDVAAVDDTSLLPRAPFVEPLAAPRSGTVVELDARQVGYAVVELGGGRARKEDPEDPAVGVILEGDAKVGAQVSKGQPLLWVHARTREAVSRALARLEKAYRLTDEPVKLAPFVRYIIR